VLVIVLRLTAWKPILKGLKSREDAIRTSIEAAAKAKADAEKATQEMESRLAAAQAEAAKQLNQAKADALKLADAIKSQAEAESAALKDRAMRDIEAAKQQALSEINARAADVGVAVARKILRREVTASDQSRLVEESLAELGTTKI
jgi:F-type H+-transporting ATPase subunit b